MLSRRGKRLVGERHSRAATIIVVEIGGKMAGYATIGRNRARELRQQGEIYELYLLPEYQGVGLGTRLFAAARARLRAWAQGSGCLGAGRQRQRTGFLFTGAGGVDIAEGVEVFDQVALRKVAFVWD
jgi:GNAT superfamily N-acetyltransferase